jgi:hypothetical protein
MNKEVLLALIEKDINELAILNKGFSEHEPVSATILNLAKTKAENILSGLHQLGELQAQPVIKIAEKEATIPTKEQEVITPDKSIVYSTPVAKPEQKIDSKPVVEVSPVCSFPMAEENPSVEYHPKVSLAETLNSENHSLGETLALSAEQSLASILSNGKIEDLRQSLSLAERFRFQRELFNGNGEKLNTTLSALNSLRTEEEANAYMAQFGWKEEDACTIDFKQLIHRKFL